MSRGGSRTAATSKMERFVIIVNGFKPLTIITKRSILDVAAVLDPPLMSQTSPCKLEYILNPIYPSKDKDIKKVNKLNSTQERNNTRKTPYNDHDPEFEVEVGDKSTSGK